MPVGEQIGTLLVEALVEVDECKPAAGERLDGGVGDGEARELTPKDAGCFVEHGGWEVSEGSGGGCAAHLAKELEGPRR